MEPRGTDEEGAAALHEGVVLAERSRRSSWRLPAGREIAWVQFLRAEYGRAEDRCRERRQLAGDDDEEMGWVDVIVGTGRMDVGDYACRRTAAALLGRARRAGPTRPTCRPIALSMLGRYPPRPWGHRDCPGGVRRGACGRGAAGWTAFRPWPEAFRGEIDLIGGDVRAARERFEHAFAVGREVGDPCWESIGMRGLASSPRPRAT